MDKIRLNKFIASTGMCSRRKAEEYILAGRVSVNGQIISELGTQVRDTDNICIDGEKVFLEERKVYIMLNKPKGYITTAKDQFNRKSVLDIVSIKERIYPVGRLDMDSEGLLLLTNDGDFANDIIHPTKHITKKYEVVLKENITTEGIKILENGVDIGGYTTQPAKIERLANNKILITITEGKNRQVRRMCEAIGNKVVNLKRLSIGGLDLGNLKSGKYIELTCEERESVFN